MKRHGAPIRAWAGIGVASLLSMWATFHFLDEYTIYSRQSPDPWGMARQQVRYAAVRADLPARSVVGYYSDVPTGAHEGDVAFFATLYSLAPHLVVEEVRSQRPDLVIGNFSKMPDLGRLERESGLKLVKNYRGGVMLFRWERE